MKRLQQIIYGETRGPVLLTLVLLTFIVFTREFGRLVELLIQQNATPLIVLKVIAYLLPSILVYTIPFAFLIGTLIGFGRLSADSEIIAMRAGGVSIYQMIRPMLKAAVVVTFLTGLFTLVLMPEGNWRLRLLRHEIRLAPATTQLKPRIFFEDFPGFLLYVEDLDPARATWEGIFVADSSAAGERRLILAREGRSLNSEDGRRLQLHLEEGLLFNQPLEFPERTTLSRFKTLDFPVELPDIDSAAEKVKRAQDKGFDDLLTDIRRGNQVDRDNGMVELQRRIALPLASLAFAVIAVTLGIRTPRGGRGFGFILSVVVAFVYYLLFATGSTLSKNGVLPTAIGVWGANIAMLGLSLLTLRLADRESRWYHRFSNSAPVLHLLNFRQRWGLRLRNGWEWVRHRFSKHLLERLGQTPSLRLRVARIIDLFVARAFLQNFLMSLLASTSLVCLFTFFEIIDNVFENRIPYSLVIDYFFFLQPHFFMLLVPISVLIGTLVTFGSLEKFNQTVAFKSCGISIYRVAAPVFVLAALVSSSVFVLQEYVLPSANQRQDNLRNIIKGKPAQTSRPGRRWIFGNDGHLYNYSLFSSKWDVFLDLTVYRLDLSESRLIEITYAERAEWDRDSQKWLLHGGWVRNLEDPAFTRFQKVSLVLPEQPDFFEEEVRDSSKMTYSELENYIEGLQIGGFEVDYLKTELFKKVSFPLVSLIMALMGVPFALTMGRKGALYGIAAGVLLGIAYWGAFGIFDVLGANGLLAPVLAAWGPNIVFGAGATILLSMVRT